jgi:predicted O-methyltransferase YrrM
MTMLASFLPQRANVFLGASKQRARLALLQTILCDTSPLTRSLDESKLRAILTSDSIATGWGKVAPQLRTLMGTEARAGGVNPGDRRAIFYLVRALAPRSVLEIGTHIGASTLSIAAALREARSEGLATSSQLTTVDIADVNDPVTQPWTRTGAAHSPREMIRKLGADDWTRFVTRPSLEYLSHCTQTFDFIFLDGDHGARTVYQEIPAALKVLNPGGAILLHDYFPQLEPLWSNGSVIPGPWLAAERLRAEGATFRVLPLGELPWPTKLGSRMTGLALMIGH